MNENICLEELEILSKKVWGEIFKGREKAKQRVVYDLLNHLRKGDNNKFLYQILKLLASNSSNETIRMIEIINQIFAKSSLQENFEKIGYAIIMGLMTAKGGE
ncbi:conserved hypothetical protein [Thermosulfidibacter takaii ABI70S6]|uniref:Uncharacterized protein n=1 Tax=Thermosulfidibacter takaii (strain DSM 17441 / JCM 13301 / NBRC 103674 / ABI70S6) TaxID=1298851 RepID=A0A0S3QU16_THET7|nr:hypothetical protein [Thermosulfidibacter takaii]BAT71828.1 conserved hypothetical protein [Thermosulfidibacter takaii ABI70S6]